MKNNIETQWYKVHNENEIETPGLLISPEIIKNNINEMIKIAGNPSRLWPHIKTYKMKPIIELQKNHGINRFKCATIGEVKLLCESNVNHILLAIQPTEKKLYAFIELQKKYPEIKFSTLLDNEISFNLFDKTSKKLKQKIAVWIDINSGMDRTGILPDKNAFKLYKKIKNSTVLKFKGLHAYDGHIRSDSELKRRKDSDSAYLSVLHLKQKIEHDSKKTIKIVAGGSPSFLPNSYRKDVYLSPGTTLLWDIGYGNIWKESPFQIAAILATRIISKPNKNILCLDLGHKAIASEMPLPRVKLIGLEDAVHIGQSEEHLVIKTKDASKYEVGHIIYALPKHICPTVIKYNQSHIIKNKKLFEYWDIEARDYNYNENRKN